MPVWADCSRFGALVSGTLVIAAGPAAAAPPDAPGTPDVVALNAEVVVSFAPPFDGGSTILFYTATCSSSDGGVTGFNSASAAPITVTGLSNGNTYTCTVFAHNADGDGAQSAASLPVVPNTTPDAPTNVSVLALGGVSPFAVVSFTPPFDGGSPITGYTAACSSADPGTVQPPPVSAPPSVTAISVAPIDVGHPYTCTVTAENIDGTGPTSAPSAPATANSAPGQPAPPSPVTPLDGSILVEFAAPGDGGSAITSYTAACSSSDGGLPGTASGFPSPILVTGLSNGNTYTCTVFATNVNGDGPVSLPSTSVVPNTVPGAPNQPSVARGNQRIDVSFFPPAETGGTAINGYTANCVSSNGGTNPNSVTSLVSPITVTGVTNGKQYTCTVTASNANGQGPLSVPSPPVVPGAVPGAPARPAVSAANGRLTVSFTTPATNGLPISSYRARCTSSDGGVIREASSTHSPIVLNDVSNGYRYTCTVYAANSIGSGPRSAASGVVVAYGRGFRMFSGDGGVFVFGDSVYYGSAAAQARSLVIGMATTRDNKGYWLAAQDGSVYAFGDAKLYGSMGGTPLNQPIVGITATPSGKGFWLVARDGGIFAFGDAPFFGSTGNIRLNQPIVGMTPTASGRGYWFVAADGGLFAYGDAHFFGSASGKSVSPIVGMANTASGNGYWIANAAGQVFAFGDASNYNPHPLTGLRLQIMGIAPTPTHKGFWLVAGDGGLFNFGDAPYIKWSVRVTLRRIIRGVSQ